MARITAGKLRLEQQLVDLRDVVRDALQVVKPGADVKGIGVALDLDPATVPVHGDTARLQQIASNLLSNAVKFTPAGGAVHVRLTRTGHGVLFAVSDTGQGISPSFLPWVFEPFRQADALIRKVRGADAPRLASIPAAALTAFAREEDRQTALQAGFQLHLAKPVDAPSLVAAVTNLRDQRIAS